MQLVYGRRGMCVHIHDICTVEPLSNGHTGDSPLLRGCPLLGAKKWGHLKVLYTEVPFIRGSTIHVRREGGGRETDVCYAAYRWGGRRGEGFTQELGSAVLTQCTGVSPASCSIDHTKYRHECTLQLIDLWGREGGKGRGG